MYRLCFYGRYLKILYCRNFFYKEIEFTIVQLAHRLFPVLSVNPMLLHLFRLHLP